MEPIAFLQSVLKINRTGTVFIMTGLAVLAAAALALSWLGDGQNAITLAIYILGFGVLVALLSFIVTNPLMKTVLGWMFIAGFGMTMFVAVDSVMQITNKVPYPVCLRAILEKPPHTCMAEFDDGPGEVVVAAKTAPDPSITSQNNSVVAPAPAPPPNIELSVEEPLVVMPPSASVQDPPRIFMHFVAPVSRETARTTATLLVDDGWAIEGGTEGGQEIAKGPSTTQIRYYSAAYADEAAALANSLSTALNGTPVSVRDFSNSGLLAAKNLFEIWIAPPQAS